MRHLHHYMLDQLHPWQRAQTLSNLHHVATLAAMVPTITIVIGALMGVIIHSL